MLGYWPLFPTVPTPTTPFPSTTLPPPSTSPLCLWLSPLVPRARLWASSASTTCPLWSRARALNSSARLLCPAFSSWRSAPLLGYGSRPRTCSSRKWPLCPSRCALRLWVWRSMTWWYYIDRISGCFLEVQKQEVQKARVLHVPVIYLGIQLSIVWSIMNSWTLTCQFCTYLFFICSVVRYTFRLLSKGTGITPSVHAI